jgi:predicted nucleotidyltransferase component of viral defense system
MHDDYYGNILYPLQYKVLEIVAELPVDFYLTGGTALSRAYLNHRYSDDLDFL